LTLPTVLDITTKFLLRTSKKLISFFLAKSFEKTPANKELDQRRRGQTWDREKQFQNLCFTRAFRKQTSDLKTQDP